MASNSQKPSASASAQIAEDIRAILSRSKDPTARAAVRYLRRRDRQEHPKGETDPGGRWWPDGTEHLDETEYRTPSRKWPWSLMIACRTVKHCAALEGADIRETRRLSKLIDAVESGDKRLSDIPAIADLVTAAALTP